MTLTPTQRIAYQFLTRCLLMWLVSFTLDIINRIRFLDPAIAIMPVDAIHQLAELVRLLALVSGVIGGGLYALSHERPDRDFPLYGRWLSRLRWAWAWLCNLTLIAGALRVQQFGPFVTLEPLDVPITLTFEILLIGILGIVAYHIPRWWSLPSVWCVGVGLIIIGSFFGLIPNFGASDQVGNAVTSGIREYFGIGLCIVALVFWQMRRFSTLSDQWIGLGIYAVGGFWSLAAALLTIQPLMTVPFRLPISAQIGGLGVIALPVIAAIYASHAHLAFSNRNASKTLSEHWVGLAIILFLIGVGFIGSIGSLLSLDSFLLRFYVLRQSVIQFAYAAALFGIINQVGAELRGENRRITGLAPFWLVSFGWLIAIIGLGIAGVVGVYLGRFASLDFAEMRQALMPLYTLWLIGLISAALGFVGYALGFYARRIRE